MEKVDKAAVSRSAVDSAVFRLSFPSRRRSHTPAAPPSAKLRLRPFRLRVALCLACVGGSVVVAAPDHGNGATAEIAWQTDYAKAARTAKEKRRPLLVEFYADWCGPCQLMSRTTFRNPAVVAACRRLLCVHVNVDANRKVARLFAVNAIPRLVVVNPAGVTILDVQGYTDADTLLSLFKSAGLPVGGAKGSAHTADAARPPDTTAALVEALGSRQRALRDEAARRLLAGRDKSAPALLDGLTHQRLSVRVGAWTVLRALTTPPVSLRYDPWAAKPKRRQQAEAVRRWWKARAKKP